MTTGVGLKSADKLLLGPVEAVGKIALDLFCRHFEEHNEKAEEDPYSSRNGN